MFMQRMKLLRRVERSIRALRHEGYVCSFFDVCARSSLRSWIEVMKLRFHSPVSTPPERVA